MWIVETHGGNLYGPFKSANAAIKWTKNMLSDLTVWKLVRLRHP